MRNIKSLSLSAILLTTFWFTIGCEYKMPVVHTLTDCLGYDGLPFEDSSIAAICCENDANGYAVIKADADEKKCRGGLFEAAHNQNNNMNNSLSMAAAQISQTAAILGVQVDIKSGPKTLTNKSGTKGADTFAAVAPPGALNRPGNSGSMNIPGIGSSGGLSGGGSNGGGNSGTGGGLGSGGSGSKGSGFAGTNDPAPKVQNSKTGTSYGANSAEKARKDGGDPTAVGNSLKVEGETWGQVGAKGPEGAIAANEGEEGSANDPSDYFSRIKKGDSLFAIVANRYKIKQVKMNSK